MGHWVNGWGQVKSLTIEILGSESFARWLISLALVLEIELALDIEHYRITSQSFDLPPAITSVSHLTCPPPPHYKSELEIELVLVLEIELALVLDIEHYHVTASVSHLTCPLPPHQSVI